MGQNLTLKKCPPTVGGHIFQPTFEPNNGPFLGAVLGIVALFIERAHAREQADTFSLVSVQN